MKAKLFLATATMAAFAFMLSAPAFAQWLNYPTPDIPRLPNGKPNLENDVMENRHETTSL